MSETGGTHDQAKGDERKEDRKRILSLLKNVRYSTCALSSIAVRGWNQLSDNSTYKNYFIKLKVSQNERPNRK
jgi:hypothetical protein